MNTSVSVTIRTRDVRFFFLRCEFADKKNHSAGSNAWVCSRSLLGTAILNPFGDMGLSLVNILCCQVEVSATGRSIIQRSPPETERKSVCVCVTECDQVQQQPSTPTVSKMK
jgi:hypothetical protein